MSQSPNSPTVSIITVAFNAADTIERTLRSVASQTETDYEHIVMDGASTDGTLDIVDRYANPRLNLTSSPDLGIYDAMNKALAVASGRYVLFLNAGDTFADNNVLARYTEAISKNPDVDIVYGQTVITDGQGNVIGERHLKAPESLNRDSFKNGMVVCHQAFMARREIAPLYTLDYRFSADYEWCLRCIQTSRKNIYLGDEPVIHYLNEGVTTANHRASLKERYKIMCRYYGKFPTMLRHLRFAFRHLIRKFTKK